MRKSQLFFYYIIINTLVLMAMFVHASWERKANMPSLQEKNEMVRRLGLSDLCLFTDARYTRHPTLADRHAPFQDYPLSFEHFPSGSLMTLPQHLNRTVRK